MLVIIAHIKRKTEGLFLLSDPELMLVWLPYGGTFSELVSDIIYGERWHGDVLPQKEGRNNLPHLVAPSPGLLWAVGRALWESKGTDPSAVNNCRQTRVSWASGFQTLSPMFPPFHESLWYQETVNWVDWLVLRSNCDFWQTNSTVWRRGCLWPGERPQRRRAAI